MLDILVALIEELLGKKKTPPPRPRRQVRQADVQRSDAETVQAEQRQSWYDTSTTPVDGQNPVQFDQMVRQFFGMRDEEEDMPEESPQPVVEVREPGRNVAAPQTLTGTLTASAPAPAPLMEPLATEPQRRLGEESSLREIVHDLRNNPDAAREAFLYAEIFGPPLADR